MAKIAWKDLPEWARKAISEGGPYSQVQRTHNGATLTLSAGIARYNGSEVAPYGEEVNENEPEETVLEGNLPDWAKTKVRVTPIGSQSQVQNNGSVLQITAAGDAFYNGKRVIRTSRMIESTEEAYAREQAHHAKEIEVGNMVLAYPEGKPVWMRVRDKHVIDDLAVIYELVTAGGVIYYTTAAFLTL